MSAALVAVATAGDRAMMRETPPRFKAGDRATLRRPIMEFSIAQRERTKVPKSEPVRIVAVASHNSRHTTYRVRDAQGDEHTIYEYDLEKWDGTLTFGDIGEEAFK